MIILAFVLAAASQEVTVRDLLPEIHQTMVTAFQGHAVVIPLDEKTCAMPVELWDQQYHCRPDHKLIVGIPMDAQPIAYPIGTKTVLEVKATPWLSHYYDAVPTVPEPLERMAHETYAKGVAYNTHAQAKWAGYHVLPAFLSSPFFGYAPITEVFGARRYYGTSAEHSTHIGVDIPAPKGTSVSSVAPGIVVLAQKLWSEGNTVIIYHGDGIYSAYCHLDTILVKADEFTFASEIGTVGGTSEARTIGPHLHFVIRINGVPVDPLDALKTLANGLRP